MVLNKVLIVLILKCSHSCGRAGVTPDDCAFDINRTGGRNSL